MRKVVVFAVLGMALPSLAAAQTPRAADVAADARRVRGYSGHTPPGAGKFTIAGSSRADGRKVMAAGETVVIEAGTDAGRGGRPAGPRRAGSMAASTTSQAFRRGADGYAGIRTAAPADGDVRGRPLRAGAHRPGLRRGDGRRLSRPDSPCRRLPAADRRGRRPTSRIARACCSAAICATSSATATCSSSTAARPRRGPGTRFALYRDSAERPAARRARRSRGGGCQEGDVARGGRAGARLS